MTVSRAHGVQRPLPQASSASSGFRFGYGFFDKSRVFTWDPDREPNAHAVIWGSSGSGKSRLLRNIIAYLSQAGKHIHVLDQHGDLRVRGENVMVFGDPDLDHGINPFAFDKARHAGPSANVHAMVEVFRRTYLSSMGPMQELILRQLLMDSYRAAGIDPDRPDTWKGSSQLPSLDVTRELIQLVTQAIDNGSGDFFSDLREAGKRLSRIRDSRDTIEQGDPHTGDSRRKLAAFDLEVGEIFDEITASLRSHLEVQYLGGAPSQELDHLIFDGNNIDLSIYLRKNARRALDSLSLYIEALCRHRVFSSKPPPVRPGLNRYDLSLLPDGPRHFFIEAFLAKVFRAIRQRGEYRRLARRPRGDRCDTFIVIDEAQNILPKRSGDKESHTYVLNRMVAEARKFGLGIVCVTQSPALFPRLLFSNVAFKIGLRTNQNDIPTAMRYLGVQEALFNHAKKDNVAMVAGKESEFHSVLLDWNSMPAALEPFPE